MKSADSSNPQDSQFFNWDQITVNFRKKIISKNKKYFFKFNPFATDLQSSCIKREKYIFEFLRLFGVDPYQDDYNYPHALIIGSSSSIGRKMKKIIKTENIKLFKNDLNVDNNSNNIYNKSGFINDTLNHVIIMKIADLEAFNFLDPNLRKVLNLVNITSIYICDSIREFMFCSDYEGQVNQNNKNYFYNLFDWINSNKQFPKVTFFRMHFKSHSIISEIVSNYKRGKIVDIPFFIDDENTYYDPHNALIHTQSECMLTQKSRLIDLDFGNYSSTKVIFNDDLHEILYNQFKNDDDNNAIKRENNAKNKEKDHFSFLEYIRFISNEYKCEIEINKDKTFPQQINATSSNLSQLIDLAEITKKLTNKMKIEVQKPYVSIVVVGRHDGFSSGYETRAQNFLYSLSNHSQKIPLSNFEIVFVDYATPKENIKLSEVFEINNPLKGKIRFINVPVTSHYRLNREMNSSVSFYEYIAKNIGIRRSRGEYILTTNPDNIFNSDFFDQIQRKQFSDGILYRANRYSCKRDVKYDIKKLIELLDERPFTTLESSFELASRCPTNIKGSSFEISVESLTKDAWPCGAGDFIMMSRGMWDALGGFNEYPGNANVDALLLGKMMKFVPGYVRHMMRAPIIHQFHPRKNIFRPAVNDHEQMMKKYACRGECASLGKFQDNINWGLIDETYSEDKL